MARKRRDLTPEEKRLWKQVTKNDLPLHAPAPEEHDDPVEETSPPPPKPPAHLPALPPKRAVQHSPLLPGDYRDLDGANTTRMKRGKYAVGMKLDLHGLDRLEAQDMLTQAIERAHSRGMRMILVITGKGRAREGQESGVLKSHLPVWLNLPGIRDKVVAYDTARVEHGGTGAYYVLIRRRRE